MLNVADYTIVEELDIGRYTVVYRARHQQTGQPVVIKALKEEYPSLDQITALKNEFEISRGLEIAGIVRPLDLVRPDKDHRLAILLEDFGGYDLKRQLESGAVNFTRSDRLEAFLQLAIELAHTLAQLHRHNIIHKDVNPRNLIYNPLTGQLKLTDFSIASRLAEESQEATTSPGRLEGTLFYLAPEQSGRMNRLVDYRTDFYSLGVTFYELLTGQLPFHSTDPLELIHAHLARQPRPPHELNSALPPVLSEIVLKLLAKTAEERYQSGFGLQADLERCLKEWQASGHSAIIPFRLARHDLSDRFHLPQKLYGRETEIATLLEAFEMVSQGTASQLVLVQGYSGIGKSALVQEIQKPLVRQRGYFCSGKFDQYQRGIPYASLIQAFSGLVRQLLTESDHQLAAWREKLTVALGANAQVIIEVIPEVALIIGPQPPVAELAPTETQNRFQTVFQDFVAVFARPEHPLALFLDDLQWADPPSLRLLKTLIGDSNRRYLLVIGAYRDNEVIAGDPLYQLLDDLWDSGYEPTLIKLRPLELADLTSLVADAFSVEPAQAAPLATLVLEKTEGNPFFVGEFLKTLYSEGLLEFDPLEGGWRWDLGRVRIAGITANVVELMAGKLQKLSPSCQERLQLAACLGGRFELGTLAQIAGLPPGQVAAELWEALQAGLIVPLDKNYRLWAISSGQVEAEIAQNVEALAAAYRFLHDRVQQAAYSLLPVAERPATHLRIGRVRLAACDGQPQDDDLFEIVNQLNMGVQLITEEAERLQLAELNRQAGSKARASVAYEPALRYLTQGMNLLPPNSWQLHYDLTFDLYKERATCEYLSGNFEITAGLIRTAAEQARTDLEKAEIYYMQVTLLISNGLWTEALEVGLKVCHLLGVNYPARVTTAQLVRLIGELRWQLRGKQLNRVLDLSTATDPAAQLLFDVSVKMAVAANSVNYNLFVMIALGGIKISLRYGVYPTSATGLAAYGLLAGAVLGDYKLAHRVGQVALQLADRFQVGTFWGQTYSVVGAAISFWTEPVKVAIERTGQGHPASVADGDLDFAGYSMLWESEMMLYAGWSLSEVYSRTARNVEFSSRATLGIVLNNAQSLHQLIRSLLGETDEFPGFSEPNFDETTFVGRVETNALNLSFYGGYKVQVLYLAGHYAEAYRVAQWTEKELNSILGFVLTAEYFFYYALTAIRLAEEAGPGRQRRDYLKKARSLHKRMARWNKANPTNFRARYLLVQAELSRVAGDFDAARGLYDQAIKLADRYSFLQIEGLANELAGRFHLAAGLEKQAQAYMQEARQVYQDWGALAKQRQLEATYPQFFSKTATTPTFTAVATTTRPRPTLARTIQTRQLNSTVRVGTTTNEDAVSFDFATVLRAAQAISSEIRLGSLLEKLMRLALENAGAQRGFFIFEKEGHLVIEAAGSLEQGERIAVLTSQPLEESGELAISVVQYVARTRQNVVLQSACHEGQFVSDPYIEHRQVQSVLCSPLFNQGRLSAILYLENSAVSDLFTPQRLEVVQLVLSQAAIAIDNAMLYARLAEYNTSLEHRVAERTLELEQARQQAEIARAEAEAANRAKSMFLANMSHELRTPLNAIIGYSEMLSELAEDDGADEYITDLEKIAGSGKHLLNLINDILDLSKIEAGKMDLYLEEFDLATLLSDVETTVAPLVRKNANRLELRAERQNLGRVYADLTKLRQSLFNLLSNAAKFTQEGVIVLEGRRLNPAQLAAERPADLNLSDPTGDWICLRVSDSGIGMSQEQLGRLFQAFSQADASTTRKYGGTGLGLAITRRFCEMMGGAITVESAPGRGTTFMIWLPAEVADPNSKAAEPEVGVLSFEV